MDNALEAWLRLQITRAQHKLDAELQAIDRRYAAKREYRSGQRIADSIKAISDTIIPLAERIYEKAPDRAGHAAIHNYFSELNDRAIWIAKSAGAKVSPETGEPDLTLRAATDLLDRIRSDLDMQWQIAEHSGPKPGETLTGPEVPRPQVLHAPFFINNVGNATPSRGVGPKTASVKLLIQRVFGSSPPIMSPETMARKLWLEFTKHSDLTAPASEPALVKLLRRMEP